jgi:hypothetical protein
MSQPIHTPRRTAASEPVVRRQVRRRGNRVSAAPVGFGWRWVSLSICLAIVAGMVAVFSNPIFYVQHAEIGGLRYVPPEEVYASAGIANYHILYVDPAAVEQRVLESPSLESAQVIIGWPARVIINVREREPALIWEQGSDRYWVDVNGNLMLVRRELSSLVLVINEGDAIPFRCTGADCQGGVSQTPGIDPAVVLGAQQLKTLRSNIDVLYYDPVHGLSYQDGRGWRGYFGTGTDMNDKLAVYETLVVDLIARGLQPNRIDVSNLSAPYYSVAQ